MSVEKPELATAATSETPLAFDSTVTEPQAVALVCEEPGAVVVGLVVDVELTVVDVVIDVGGTEDGVAGVEVDVGPFSDGPSVVEGAPLVVTVDPADEVDVGPP